MPHPAAPAEIHLIWGWTGRAVLVGSPGSVLSCAVFCATVVSLETCIECNAKEGRGYQSIALRVVNSVLDNLQYGEEAFYAAGVHRRCYGFPR